MGKQVRGEIQIGGVLPYFRRKQGREFILIGLVDGDFPFTD
jgi:hypothetical protein